jgi:hypothetical protein
MSAKFPETLNPILPCEGRCSTVRVQAIQHSFDRYDLLAEASNGHAHTNSNGVKGPEGSTYALMYTCGACGTARMWGSLIAHDYEMLFGRSGGRGRN